MVHSTKNTSQTPRSGPVRIALAITELEVGGAEQQFVRLVAGLDRALFEPHVYCLAGEGPLAGPLREAGVPVTCLGGASRRDVRVVGRLTRQLRNLRPALLQTFLFQANIAGRLAARRAGVRCVVSGVRVAEPRRWQLRIDRASQRLVDRHVCVSESVARYCRDAAGLDPDKIVVIPNSIDARRFAEAVPSRIEGFDPAGGGQLILFVGRLEPQKDPELLLEAFDQLAPEYPSVMLAFVGKGSLETALRRQSENLRERVLWLGRREDVPGLMKAAGCLALPSRWEGMPNVVLEAMAAGLPVVACAAEGVDELLAGGRYGEVVRERSPAALAVGLRRWLAGGAEVRQRAELAQQFVAKEFTEHAMVLAYQNLYLDVLSKKVGADVVSGG